MSNDTEEDKFFVSVKGGTPEERNVVKGLFENYSDRQKADVNLVNVDGEEGDLSVHIKTPCGEVSLTKSQLADGSVLDSACGKIACGVAESSETTSLPRDQKVGIGGAVIEDPDIKSPAPEPTSEDLLDEVHTAESEHASEEELVTGRHSANRKSEEIIEDDVSGDTSSSE